MQRLRFGSGTDQESVPVLASAEAVVGESFDNSTVTYASMTAFLDHAGQLRLERPQAGNASIDLTEMIASDAVRLVTGRLRLGGHG